MGLHHKICHALGGMLDLPHAETHAVMLPHVAAFNLPFAPYAATAAGRALGVPDAAAGLRALVTRLGAPQSLDELGVKRSQLPSVAEETLASRYSNPRAVGREELTRLLETAWSGADD